MAIRKKYEKGRKWKKSVSLQCLQAQLPCQLEQGITEHLLQGQIICCGDPLVKVSDRIFQPQSYLRHRCLP